MKFSLSPYRIIMVGGPGGVGKTTLAAALGVELALQGHRTLILTVDPAKRLAQALGFQGFSSDIQKVELADKPNSQLWASMLDSEHYFDKVIERFATSAAQKEKILGNKIYRTMVESLGGSHEYAAMERVLEFANSKAYDKIIVDTPPSQNALDLLNAPQRLADFMDNSVLRWFQGKGYLKLFQAGTRMAMKLLQKVLGGEFLDNLATVLSDLEGMQAGFRNRNLEVIRLLQSPETAFLLVTHPTEPRYLESCEFASTLRQKNIPLRAAILNRVEPEWPNAEATKDASSSLREWISYLHKIYSSQKEWITQFEKNLGVPVCTVPRLPTPADNIASLRQIAASVIS